MLRLALLLLFLLACPACTGLKREFLGPTAAYRTHTAAAREAGAPILFYKTGIGHPNSVGGVSVYFGLINTTPNKTLKYVRAGLRAYDAVGEKAPCRIAGDSLAWIKWTGPIAPGASDEGAWGPVWYNSTVSRVIIERVEVDYMDGSSVVVEGEDVGRILASSY